MNAYTYLKWSKTMPQKFIQGTLLIITFFLPILVSGQNNWGIGIRLGNPSGITIKKYLESDKSLELSIGRTYWSYDDDWYFRRFDDWFEEQNFRYRDLDYLDHRRSVPIGIQLHYLIHKEISQNLAGLDWYYGFGAQIRLQGYRYDYRYKLEDSHDRDWYYETGRRVFDFDIGGDIVVGLEYTFPNTPISLFADVTLFMEIIDDPFLFWAQGGIGGRYNF